MISRTFWYARLDSNQRPLESELSGRQAGNRYGARVWLVSHKFPAFWRKTSEALQGRASEAFRGSSQIVVCALCQQLHQFPCGIHAIPCFPFGHRHIRVRWIAGFNIKLVYIRTVSEVTFQRCPCRSCLSAQKYKAMSIQQFACRFEQPALQHLLHRLLLSLNVVLQLFLFHLRMKL